MRLEQPMPDLIRVRVARDEKCRLVEVARSRGLSMSEFIRSTAAQAADFPEGVWHVEVGSAMAKTTVAQW